MNTLKPQQLMPILGKLHDCIELIPIEVLADDIEVAKIKQTLLASLGQIADLLATRLRAENAGTNGGVKH